jgi:putative phosphoribosyl transferase
MAMSTFTDRRTAGRLLAAQLHTYANRSDVIVLGVPRGGVPVAYEVALALRAPLDVFIVHKVYALAPDPVEIGAVTSGGFEACDFTALGAIGVERRTAEGEMMHARQDLVGQDRLYRGPRRFPDVRGLTVIVVYDGIVTGASMTAAVTALRALGAAQVVVATPVAAPAGYAAIARVADACIALVQHEPFCRIGVWYDDFVPVSDAIVLLLLDSASRALRESAA